MIKVKREKGTLSFCSIVILGNKRVRIYSILFFYCKLKYFCIDYTRLRLVCRDSIQTFYFLNEKWDVVYFGLGGSRCTSICSGTL